MVILHEHLEKYITYPGEAVLGTVYYFAAFTIIEQKGTTRNRYSMRPSVLKYTGMSTRASCHIKHEDFSCYNHVLYHDDPLPDRVITKTGQNCMTFITRL